MTHITHNDLTGKEVEVHVGLLNDIHNAEHPDDKEQAIKNYNTFCHACKQLRDGLRPSGVTE